MTATERINALLALHPPGYDLSLERIEGLLAKLGNPQDALPPVIHVAGTNGKGSTIAFMRAALEADDIMVHVHTSPHLVDYHERYRLGAVGGGKLVEDAMLDDAVRRAADANGGDPITVHEILTAVMFLLFCEQPADIALIEVGLGGRFDATNVMHTALISVITSISIDHVGFLGDTLEKIAFEKAGIIKDGVPVVIGPQGQGALDILERIADERQARTILHGRDFHAWPEHGRLVYQDLRGLIDMPLPALRGTHQHNNAAIAIATLRATGADLSDRCFEGAMRDVRWTGRMQRLVSGQIVQQSLLADDSEIWVDGGHNPAAGAAAAAMLSDLDPAGERAAYLIAGMLDTKDPANYFRGFSDRVSKVFTVPIPSNENSLDPNALVEHARLAGLDAKPMRSVVDALNAIAEETDPDAIRPLILITGSLYLVGWVLRDNGTPPC